MAKKRRKQVNKTKSPSHLKGLPSKTIKPRGVEPLAIESSAPMVIHQLPLGPWGEVEFYETFLEAPDEMLKLISLPSQQTVWNFIDCDQKQLLKLFQKAELTTEQTSTMVWRFFGRNHRIYPHPDMVESLSAESRAIIYRELSQWEENPAQRYPFVFGRAEDIASLSKAGFDEELIEKIARLSYIDGNITLFSDFPLLLRKITHPKFERNLIRVLTRTPTLLLRLRLSPDSDIENISAYWNNGGKRQESTPLMHSIVQTDGVETLDIAHLLPTAARGQLYTYPSQSDVILNGRAPDGFWTAINFFNTVPIPAYIDTANALDLLGKVCTPALPPYEFGDILLISPSETATPCHACVFIAGDVVFTKNSGSYFSPWILSKLDEVISYHTRGANNPGISGFRRKIF